MVVIDFHARSELDHLARVGRTSEMRDVEKVELFSDTNIANNVDLLLSINELALVQIGSRGEGRRENLFCLYVYSIIINEEEEKKNEEEERGR